MNNNYSRNCKSCWTDAQNVATKSKKCKSCLTDVTNVAIKTKSRWSDTPWAKARRILSLIECIYAVFCYLLTGGTGVNLAARGCSWSESLRYVQVAWLVLCRQIWLVREQMFTCSDDLTHTQTYAHICFLRTSWNWKKCSAEMEGGRFAIGSRLTY